MRFVYYYIIILLLFSSCYSKESLREQVVSLYEQGKQWEKIAQEDSAASYYLRSFELAKKLKEDSLIGEIGNSLGDILYMQCLYSFALSVHQEAYLYNIKMEDKKAASHSLRGIGKDYLINMPKDSMVYRMRLDSAFIHFNRAKKLIPYIKDKNEVSLIYNNLCIYYIEIKELSKALYYNQMALFTTQDSIALYKNYFCRGNIYYFFAQYDSAIYYCQKAMESKNLYTQYASCLQLTNSLRSIDSADSALYRKKAHDIREEIEKQKSEEVIMRLLQKSTQDKLRNEKNLAVLYITFIFLTLFFSGFAFYRKYNRQKLLKKEYLIFLKETELTVEQEQTHTLRKELEESKQIINYADLKKQKQEEEEKIVSSIIQIGEECAMCFQKDLFFKNIVGKLSEGSTFANEEREVLIRKVCQYFTPYIQEISKYFQLAEEDYFVCCLTLLGFSTKYCAICRGVGEAAIRVQRKRIKEKLKGFFHSDKFYNSIFARRDT